jgi:multidrug resistance efflux pump
MATPRARNNAPLKVNLKPDKPSVQSDLPPASPSLPAPQASNTVAAADVKRAQDSKNQAMGRIQEVMTKIDEAKSEVAAQQALVDAAQSSVERTKADKDKSATLLAEGVISANEASRAESYYAQATGQLEQAKAKASEAQALVGQYERELDNARKNLKQSESKFQRAQIEAKNPRPVQRVAHSSASPFSGMVAKNMPTQPQVKYKLVPMKGPIIPAPPPIPTPVHVDLMAPQKAGIAIEQAKAAVALAEQNFAKCCIYAPTDGTVVRVLVAPGQNGLARQPVILIEKS